jgi:protein-disulfide isomerase
MMLRKILLGTVYLTLVFLFFTTHGMAQEDKMVQTVIEIVRTQMRAPKGIEIKFVEKKESPIPGFYSVKLVALAPDKEIPIVVYVDETGEKVILGSLFIKGENVTRKEAGTPKPRKIDMAQLDMDKSPSRGPDQAKVTIVEFSNFNCPYCLRSWKNLKALIDKHPQDIRYVFKHFPIQPVGRELSEMVAATQDVSNDAFWAVHDFFFSDEGQSFVNKGKEVWKQKIEEILKGKGYRKKRVDDDMALGSRIPVLGTPTTLVNGDYVRGGITDKVLERYLK